MSDRQPGRSCALLAAGTVTLLLAASIWIYLGRTPAPDALSGGGLGIDGAPGGPPDAPRVVGDNITRETDPPGGAVGADETAAFDPGALWQPIDESSVAELPAYKEVVQDRVLIRVTDAATAWRVGQSIPIPIPQLDHVYTPVIERIESAPGGVRSYIGTLTAAAGRAHRFTITTGPGNTFAHLSTPFGTYVLVASGELGWLMPAANMDQHVDYSVPDFVIPEGPDILEALR